MRLYKKMVRPYSLECAWQGMSSSKIPLADWMDEELRTEVLEKEMVQKCADLDKMSALVWEEKYEYVCSPRIVRDDGKFHPMTTDEFNIFLRGKYIRPAANMGDI